MRLRTRGRRKLRRRFPKLNTTATADISFMLLIFFLLTTSFDSEKGLQRLLPPKEEATEDVQSIDVAKENVITLGLTADNRFTVNDTTYKKEEIITRLIPFIKKKKDKHIIEVVVDSQADYDTYFQLQNIIVSTYKQLRNEEAKRRYRKPYERCDETQRETIRQTFPQRISERFLTYDVK